MKICFLGSYSGGGTERITFNLASELAKLPNYDVCLLNTGSSNPRFDLSGKVSFKRLCELTSKQGLINRIKALRKYLQKEKFDIVVSIEALTGIILIPATIGLKCKVIVWEHANYFQSQGSRWTRLIRKIWLRRANAYVVLTKRDKKNFETYEKPRCPIIQIYNPVTIKQSSEYDALSKRIISAGHLLPIKQFHLIPQIFAPIAQKYPDWIWHIYGEGPERQHIESEIVKYGLEGRVILEGATDDIDSEYAKAALYVLTSRQEGLPTVLIEAQMHGLPAVSFDIETGPDEIIGHGKSGYLANAQDIEDIAEKIETLISDSSLRESFSKNAVKNYICYDLKSVINEWRNLL